MHTRIESDLLGEIEVPAQALYGAQTQRALNNFPLGRQHTLGSYPALVKALLQIKQAAAQTNRAIGALPEDKAQAILLAAEKVLAANQPELFPIHSLHGGGGTSANMNVNEVLANLAEEHLGGQRGQYRLIHPNDHVNLNQSTNDVYPTACHMAILAEWPTLRQALEGLVATLNAKAQEYVNVRRITRTCLQDAVDNTYGDFFTGQANFFVRSLHRIGQAVEALHAVNLGGTIVGRAEDVPDGYLHNIIPNLRAVTGNAAFQHAASLFDAAQNADDVVAVSAQLEVLARGLIKISQDLRLLNSGPEAGLAEIVLPAVQPGSSIMPGKVNPAIPEFVMQMAFIVMGNHTACASALNHGELDLNIWESVMVTAVLVSMELLADAATTLAEKCLAGLKVNVAHNARNADTLVPFLVRLSRQHGYSRVNAVCKEAQGDVKLLHELLVARLGG